MSDGSERERSRNKRGKKGLQRTSGTNIIRHCTGWLVVVERRRYGESVTA